MENVKIETLMEELAKKLRSVSSKKQYGYLKAPLRSLVDEIVDELARDSRVAAAYGLWYDLREEVLRTYRNDLPSRVPLSRQKEFKRIKNIVIQEAVQLSEYINVYSPEDDAEQEPDGPPPNVDRRMYARYLLDHTNGGASPFACAARLLHHMGRIFQDQTPPLAGVRFTDSKLRQKMRDKRVALGHRADDHEDMTMR